MPAHYTASELKERLRRTELKAKQPQQLDFFQQIKEPEYWREEVKTVNGQKYLYRYYGTDSFIRHSEHIPL